GREAAIRRLLRDLDAGHRYARRRTAACCRLLESARLRRQSDAPCRGADRLSLQSTCKMETPGGLPPGVSIQQASGLRPMFRVTILLLAASLYLAATAAGAFAQAQNFTPRDESPEEFPAGAGREETFYACTACHGFKLISQQGM